MYTKLFLTQDITFLVLTLPFKNSYFGLVSIKQSQGKKRVLVQGGPSTRIILLYAGGVSLEAADY